MHIVYYVFHMILTINSEYFPMQHYIIVLLGVNCIFIYCVGEFRLQRVKNLTCFVDENLEKYESVDKGNIFRHTN